MTYDPSFDDAVAEAFEALHIAIDISSFQPTPSDAITAVWSAYETLKPVVKVRAEEPHHDQFCDETTEDTTSFVDQPPQPPEETSMTTRTLQHYTTIEVKKPGHIPEAIRRVAEAFAVQLKDLDLYNHCGFVVSTSVEVNYQDFGKVFGFGLKMELEEKLK